MYRILNEEIKIVKNGNCFQNSATFSKWQFQEVDTKNNFSDKKVFEIMNKLLLPRKFLKFETSFESEVEEPQVSLQFTHHLENKKSQI